MKKGLRSILGLACAGVALWLAFATVELDALVGTLRSANPFWLVAAFLSVFVTLTLIVTRLRLLLAGWSAPLPWAMLWHVTVVGQVANILVPLRLGDGVKVVAGSRALGLPPAAVGSVVAMERLFDVLALVTASAFLLLVGVSPGWTRPVLIGTAIAGLCLGAVGLAAVRLLSRRRAVSLDKATSVRNFVARQANLISEGFAHVGSPTAIVRLFLGSAAIALASAYTNLLTMRAFDLPVPAAAALLLLVVVQSGNAIVAAPGGIGVSQFLAIQTLGLWNVPPADALACSLVLFVVARAPKVAMLPGAIAAMSDASPSPQPSVKL